METPKIFESEYRFCLILWENEPVNSTKLVELCKNGLGWSKATTYTVIRRLSERGVVKSENAIVSALNEGGFDPAAFGAARVKAETVAARVESASGVSMMYSADWAEQYPEVYASWEQNRENSELTDYLVDYPMLKTLYEPFGFSKDYKSAHGHVYTLHDIGETKRVGEKTMASCFTCKTPEFTHKVNEEGVSTYAIPFAELKDQLSEPISCYNCHANTPGTVTITHTYLTDGVGEDFEKIDANNLACGQCHVEYYFDPGTSATVLPAGTCRFT